MKRATQEVILCPTLPVEIWGHMVDTIIQLPSDKDTVRAIFMLCKEVCEYLQRESNVVIDLSMVARLNRRCSESDWFMCSGCNKLCLYEKPRIEGRTPDSTILRGVMMMMGTFCSTCMVPCIHCSRHHLSHFPRCICGLLTGDIEEQSITVDDEYYEEGE